MQSVWKSTLISGSAILALSTVALAQNPPQPPGNQPPPAAGQAPLYDPQQLPVQRGQVRQFTLTPRGDIDGLILTDGTEIKTPPHLSTQIAYADGMILSEGLEVHFLPHMAADVCAVVRNGEKPRLKVRGVRPRGSDMIAAVAIETMDGKRIVDVGPPKAHDDDENPDVGATKTKHEPMHAEGIVRRVLHGPKGEARGALLDDGTIIRVPAKEAKHIAHLLSPEQRLAARGHGLKSELGTVIDAREVGASADDLHPLKPKEPKPKKHKDDAAANAARAV